MRPFEKSRTLVSLPPIGLEQIQALWVRVLNSDDANVLRGFVYRFVERSEKEPSICWKAIKGWYSVLEESLVHGDSMIHRLDPRVRTVAAGAFCMVVATSDRFAALVPALIIAFSFLLLSRVSSRTVVPRLLAVNGLILLLWFFLPFTVAGETLFSIGPLNGTKEGIIYSTAITVKSNTIILTLMALIGTMPIFTLGKAMRSLHMPEKIVQLISFAYRYIHVIHAEYGRLRNAMRIRGFYPRNNLHTYRTYAHLVGMLLVKSYDRARRVQAAMLCRGFKGNFYDLSEFFMKTSDRLALMLLLLLTVCIGVLQWTDIIL